MKNRIQISFNQNQFETAIASLNENLNKYKKLIDCTEKISGLRELLTLEEIENIITTKSSFKNVLLSATLLEVSDEYAFIQFNHNKINIDVLNIQGDNVETKKEVLEQIREDATTYLSEEFINEYNVLLKACIELNKLSKPNSSNFLKRDFNGKYDVNVMMLQNSNRM
jgi:hypothetical protein